MKKGFTLIELLVVIAIIAILAAMGLVAYSSATQNARNAKRISDMKAYQAMFEQYYSRFGSYNTIAVMVPALGDQQWLFDPLDGTSWYPSNGGSATGYCMCAHMEPRPTNTRGNSTDGSCSWGTGSYYCVENKQ